MCSAVVLALVSPAAHADPGAACETTAECGGLHCIEGHCEKVLDGRIWKPKLPPHQRLGLVYAGSGVFVGGLATTIAAVLLTAKATETCSGTGCPPHPYDLLGAAVPLGIAGIGAIVVGIVLIAAGTRGAPSELALGPGGVGIAW